MQQTEEKREARGCATARTQSKPSTQRWARVFILFAADLGVLKARRFAFQALGSLNLVVRCSELARPQPSTRAPRCRVFRGLGNKVGEL